MSFSGEFSSGYNPCGLFLLGVGDNTTTTGSCALFTDSSGWNATLIEGVLDFTLASMDALQSWFYWTWKVRLSSRQRRSLNVEAYFLFILADFSFFCLGRYRVAFVVVPAWDARRLGTKGSSQGLRKVCGIGQC